ncbi:MAG TPA: exosortase/archaeosortase family protein [Candidatus Bathyarchaeia archaeon]|nr:exosortase/archaeosortase family protein [Candidatus Bathyarchaeia archaeon]
MKNLKLHSTFRDKVNAFLILAFMPLLPLMYYRYAYFNDPVGSLIPLYGLLIIAMKKDQFSNLMLSANHFQRVIGIIIVVSSFFIYYAIAPIIPTAGFYGLANYTVYLLGLLLAFFKISAFKQAFSALFLITASGFTGLTFRWIEYQITPTVPNYVSLFSSVLGVFGINNAVRTPLSIDLYTPQGRLPVYFEAGCLGIYSVIVFSIIIVVTMVETPVSKRTKLLWSFAGAIGVYLLNIVRLLIVVASMYFYGYDFGQQVHQVIGYALFLSWLAIFLLLFNKRQTIIGKVQLVQRKFTDSLNRAI